MLNGSGENCLLLRLVAGAYCHVTKYLAINGHSPFGKLHYCLIALIRLDCVAMLEPDSGGCPRSQGWFFDGAGSSED